MGTSDHLRGVGTAGSMLMTSRRVAFCSRLLGSPPTRTFTVLSGSRKSPLPRVWVPRHIARLIARRRLLRLT
jgi:hypothetical protein